MKGKKLEILVLVIAFVILATAMFFMFVGGTENDIKAISMVNRLFSVGFLVYIAYSYLLSNNLNKEITELEKNINNLKDEVSRMRKKNDELTTSISQKDSEISTLSSEKSTLEKDVDSLKKQLTKAKAEVKKLTEEVATESKPEEKKEE
jgi:septal ring factor EnvC (AmiA/AmiB activator)